MDEDEVYEEYIESEPAMTPTKLKWIDPVIVLVQVVEELITAVADGFGRWNTMPTTRSTASDSLLRQAASSR
jgi:hypothetical protein